MESTDSLTYSNFDSIGRLRRPYQENGPASIGGFSWVGKPTGPFGNDYYS
jgi:hypothetical protein